MAFILFIFTSGVFQNELTKNSSHSLSLSERERIKRVSLGCHIERPLIHLVTYDEVSFHHDCLDEFVR